MNDRDYHRFIRSMHEFNCVEPAVNLGFHFDRYGHQLVKSDFTRKQKELVDIICFCLMPNHYHFMLRQKIDGGITEFMRKIGTGYTNYFNLKYQRVGSLFQGKFKAILIEKQAHLLYLPHYMHLNPLDIKIPEWREQKIRSIKNALKFLESYPWSSYQDYIGHKKYPALLAPDYQSPTSIKNYKKDIEEWLSEFMLDSVHDIAID